MSTYEWIYGYLWLNYLGGKGAFFKFLNGLCRKEGEKSEMRNEEFQNETRIPRMELMPTAFEQFYG